MNSNKFLQDSKGHEDNFNVNRNMYTEELESAQKEIKTEKISRLEIIDHTSTGEGRAYIKRGDLNVEFSLQDDNKTLKIFITDNTK